MPVMRWRVVCALRDVMLTFWPTSAFISVDLPTFGRPTIATMPQRKPVEVEAFIVGCCKWLFRTRGGRCRWSASLVARVGCARRHGAGDTGFEFRGLHGSGGGCVAGALRTLRLVRALALFRLVRALGPVLAV